VTGVIVEVGEFVVTGADELVAEDGTEVVVLELGVARVVELVLVVEAAARSVAAHAEPGRSATTTAAAPGRTTWACSVVVGAEEVVGCAPRGELVLVLVLVEVVVEEARVAGAAPVVVVAGETQA
jgi:hypothetical protein